MQSCSAFQIPAAATVVSLTEKLTGSSGSEYVHVCDYAST